MHYEDFTRINVVYTLFTGIYVGLMEGSLICYPFGFILKREKTGQPRDLTAGPFP